MLGKLFKILKRTIVSFFMLYGYNIIVPSTAIIPINIITVILITIFGLPALLILIVIRLIVY